MAEPFLAEIKLVGFNFAPRGFAKCEGQILPINQNQALFSLLGTTYGGDGRTTFALPDLRGTMPIHQGTQPRTGTTVRLGEKVGPLQEGRDGKKPVTLSLSFVIALSGLFPSRN